MKSKRIETVLIHEGYHPSKYEGSLNPPLFQTSTFTFEHALQGERRFAGEEKGYIYSRLGNPTVQILDERMAVLEQGEAALSFASGMAAVSSVLFGLLKTGDHILCSQGIYGCTYGLLQLMKEKYGVSHDFSPMDNEEMLRSQLRPTTRCIYIETPINPTMKIIDLEMVVKIAKEKGIIVVVDNTFSSPYLQQPLTYGCDIVIHSATKYIGGHGDVIAGIVVGKKDFINEIRMTTQKDIGGVISPFDAWLLLRGLKTLHIRMDRHCENAEKVVSFLKKHPQVENVFYPFDPEHPQYGIAKKQMKRGGGVLSFTINGTKEDAQRLMNHLQTIRIAVSLGDAETLIQHPATMTHSVIPQPVRESMGIYDHMLRMSIGLEAWEDICADLDQALSSFKHTKGLSDKSLK
jgi:methionine-gamma-lyase